MTGTLKIKPLCAVSENFWALPLTPGLSSVLEEGAAAFAERDLRRSTATGTWRAG